MRLSSLVFGVGLACAAASVAGAGSFTGADRMRAGFPGSDTLWRGAEDLEPCPRGRLQSARLTDAQPRFRVATRQRHGWLIGEIRGPRSMSPLALAKARDCAGAAGAAAAAPPAQRGAEFARFQASFNQCMKGETSRYVGSLTLWIDDHCDW